MRIFTWLFFATLSTILFLQRLGFNTELKTPASPHGIIGYELAWSSENAQAIITDWRANDVIEAARVRLGVDFAFLVAYPVLLSLGIRILLRQNHIAVLPTENSFKRVGVWLSRAVVVCILLDVVKNLILWRMLTFGATDLMTHLATACAITKFLLAGSAILWSLVALIRRFQPPVPVSS